MDSHVYVIKARSIKWVKIGRSGNITQTDSRVTSIIGREPFESFLYGVSECLTESQVHSELKKFRIRSEWFRWTREVKEYIHNICDVFLAPRDGEEFWDIIVMRHRRKTSDGIMSTAMNDIYNAYNQGAYDD